MNTTRQKSQAFDALRLAHPRAFAELVTIGRRDFEGRPLSFNTLRLPISLTDLQKGGVISHDWDGTTLTPQFREFAQSLNED